MQIEELIKQTQGQNWQEKLKFIAKVENNITFSTSFSIEDQVITDFIAINNLPIAIFTLDTGRLPEATYIVWQETLDKYKKYNDNFKISAYYPDAQKIEEFVSNQGINPFYKSKEARLSCCGIRKVEPLKRALKGKKLWISGIRKEHSPNRGEKEFFEFDKALEIIKFYPLLEASEDDIWQYIKKNNIPYNQLYDQGYKSIGCDPCSRAIKEGEDIRAGRWWWEESNKECGLHMVDGKLTKARKDLVD